MPNLLVFDSGKAASLEKTLMSKDRDMRATLNKISRTVESRVNENWLGDSAISFTDLFKASSDNIVSYLNSWLECTKDLLEETKKAKEANEQAEKSAINMVQNQFNTHTQVTA